MIVHSADGSVKGLQWICNPLADEISGFKITKICPDEVSNLIPLWPKIYTKAIQSL